MVFYVSQGAGVATANCRCSFAGRTNTVSAAQLSAEHAPQREGDPLGKATVERGFGILKTIAAPLLSLSDRIAAVVPTLRNAELAKGLGHLLIAALLRTYQAGARAARAACEQRAGLDEATLDRVASRARQDARTEENSRRLLLTHWREIYQFELPLTKLIHGYRRYPLHVLKQAESQLRSRLHRTNIHSLTRYFGQSFEMKWMPIVFAEHVATDSKNNATI